MSLISKRKVFLYIAASIDGYIAGENGEMGWLNDFEGEGDNGFSSFYQTIDTIIMGRKTYDSLMTMVDEFPHADKTCYIFSHSNGREEPHVQFINQPVDHFINNLLKQEGSNIWLVGGSELLAEFLKEQLVDEMVITTVPIILGKGIPLFKKGVPETKFEVIKTIRLGEFVQIHYNVRY